MFVHIDELQEKHAEKYQHAKTCRFRAYLHVFAHSFNDLL